jgi:hypothetical protein
MKQYTYDEAIDKIENLSKETWDSEEHNAIMSSLIDRHKDDIVDDDWEDFYAMISDMKAHALINGQAIEIQDRPIQLRWGWRCVNTRKTWSIKISALRKHINSLEDQVNSDILKRSMSTQEGKNNLLDFINGK